MELLLTGNDIGNGLNLAKEGAQAALMLLREIERIVQTGTTQGGEFDIHAITKMLGDAMAVTGEFQRGLLLAISDFIGSAIEGCVPDLASWDPMDRITLRLVSSVGIH